MQTDCNNQTTARINAAIDRAADGLVEAVGITPERAYDLIRSLMQQPDPAALVDADALRLRPAAWVAELRGYALGEDQDVARWKLSDAQALLDQPAEAVGQAFLDYLSQTVGAGLQPTKLGGLSSAKCDQIRQALDQAGRAYFAAFPSLGFTATIRAWSIRAARNGGNAVSLDRNPATRGLLRALNDAAAWLNE